MIIANMKVEQCALAIPEDEDCDAFMLGRGGGKGTQGEGKVGTNPEACEPMA